MIIVETKYSVTCDDCGINTAQVQPVYWMTSDTVMDRSTHMIMEPHRDREHVITVFTDLGWKISEERCICPRCLHKKYELKGFTSLAGKTILEKLNEYKHSDDVDELYSIGNDFIYEAEVFQGNTYRLEFMIDADEAIYKYNYITIKKDGDVDVQLCERYEGGGAEREIITFVAKLIKTL